MCFIDWAKTSDLSSQTLEQFIGTFWHDEILSSDEKFQPS